MPSNLRISSNWLVALSFVVMLAGVSPVFAQQRIPAKKSQAEDCTPGERCGKVQLPDGIVLWGGCTLIAVRARQPGTATITGPQSTMIAFAAERSLFAVVQRREVGPSGTRFETNLVVFDATGVHAVLPLRE